MGIPVPDGFDVFSRNLHGRGIEVYAGSSIQKQVPKIVYGVGAQRTLDTPPNSGGEERGGGGGDMPSIRVLGAGTSAYDKRWSVGNRIRARCAGKVVLKHAPGSITGYVTSVNIVPLGAGLIRITFRISSAEAAIQGDKALPDTGGHKMVITDIVPGWIMPYNTNGVRPDLIRNSHSEGSRCVTLVHIQAMIPYLAFALGTSNVMNTTDALLGTVPQFTEVFNRPDERIEHSLGIDRLIVETAQMMGDTPTRAVVDSKSMDWVRDVAGHHIFSILAPVRRAVVAAKAGQFSTTTTRSRRRRRRIKPLL
jgi:hypothetical protein